MRLPLGAVRRFSISKFISRDGAAGKRAGAARRRRRLLFEQFEDRRVLAVVEGETFSVRAEVTSQIDTAIYTNDIFARGWSQSETTCTTWDYQGEYWEYKQWFPTEYDPETMEVISEGHYEPPEDIYHPGEYVCVDSETQTFWRTFTITIISQPVDGHVSVDENGTPFYTPDEGFVGNDSFTYSITDGDGEATATAMVQVNASPVSNTESYTTPMNTALTVAQSPGVLANDWDPENDPLTAVLLADTPHGHVELAADGTFIYTPNTNYYGWDSFNYSAADACGQSPSSTVWIWVVAPPGVNDDVYYAAQGTPLFVYSPGVLGNDVDPNGGALDVSGYTIPPTHGTHQWLGGSGFVYTPSENYTGDDTFQYQAVTQGVYSDWGTVTIHVLPIDESLHANNDAYTTHSGEPKSVNVGGLLQNDDQVTNRPRSAMLVSYPPHGSVELRQNGTFDYTPNAGFVGTDTFTYRFTDGVNASTVGTVSIQVYETPDLALTNFYSDGVTLQVQYFVIGTAGLPFDITLYASPSPTVGILGQPLQAALRVSGADVTQGWHTKSIPATFDDLKEDYYLKAVIDSQNEISEYVEPNNEGLFAGGSFLVHEASGDTVLHYQGTDGGDGLLGMYRFTDTLVPRWRVEGQQTALATPDSVLASYYDVTGDNLITPRDAEAIRNSASGQTNWWQNTANRFDVNGDAAVSPSDALVVINYLATNGETVLHGELQGGDLKWDVSGDIAVSVLDVRQLLDLLNGGDGEVQPEGRTGSVFLGNPAAGQTYADAIDNLLNYSTLDLGPITIDAIHIRSHGGSDAVSANGAPAWIFGGAGNDAIYGSGQFADYLDGDTGDDSLNGYGGADEIRGGDGDDWLYGDGADVSGPWFTVGADSIDGGPGNDNIFGGGANDQIYGGLGADTIEGGYGQDLIYGDNGPIDDATNPDDGDDTIRGARDADTIYGEGGNDTLHSNGNFEQNAVEAGDTIYGGPGNDTFYGWSGNDQFYGGTGNDTLNGGAGNDTLIGDDGDDVLDGSAGDDTISGGLGNDTADGGAGNDSLSGEDGNDTLNGGAGNDNLSGDSGNDTLSGGAGNDSQAGGDGTDLLTGGEGDDVLDGDAGNDELHGDVGADLVYGGAGNDLLYGDDGTHLLSKDEEEDEGGAGPFAPPPPPANDILYGGEGDDKAFGELGDDEIYGEGGNDTLLGGQGNDLIDSGEGTDVAYGGAGDDLVFGGAGNDLLYGNSGNDVLLGGENDDWLYGAAGYDSLLGGPGNDLLDGGPGNDALDGGEGSNSLYGGDEFDELALGAGNNAITEFDADPPGGYCGVPLYPSGIPNTIIVDAYYYLAHLDNPPELAAFSYVLPAPYSLPLISKADGTTRYYDFSQDPFGLELRAILQWGYGNSFLGFEYEIWRFSPGVGQVTQPVDDDGCASQNPNPQNTSGTNPNTTPAIDLDIDSNNSAIFAGPAADASERETEDQIEENSPGKYIVLNTGDSDSDGKPDYADGFDTNDVSRSADNASRQFVPITVDVSGITDPSQATITFRYRSADPRFADQSDRGSGLIRLWTKDGTAARNGRPLYSGGDFVPNLAPRTLSSLLSPGATQLTLYAEGINPGQGSIVAVLTEGQKTAVDVVMFHAAPNLLDIDSNNDGQITTDDEPVEDVQGDDDHPGKVISVSNTDTDDDGIPDYADGFDWLDNTTDDNTSADTAFTPLKVIFPEDLDLNTASFQFTYEASDPSWYHDHYHAGIEFERPTDGALRIWKKDSNISRNRHSVASGGDFIASGVSYTAAQLGITGSLKTLYVEAINPSLTTSDHAIRLKITGGGLDPNEPLIDEVRVTTTMVQIMATSGESGDEPYEVDRFGATRLPQYDSTSGAPRFNDWKQYYTLVISDPRAYLDHVTIAGQNIPLHEVSSVEYESDRFLLIRQAESSLLVDDDLVEFKTEVNDGDGNYLGDAVLYSQRPSDIVGNTRVITIGDGVRPVIQFVGWGWQEEGKSIIFSELAEDADKFISDLVSKSIDELATQGWVAGKPTNKGSFGIAVSDLFRAKLDAKSTYLGFGEAARWKTGMLVDKRDNTIVRLSGATQGIGENIVEIDAVYLKPGYNPSEGQILDQSKIIVYEIKTSADGAIGTTQLTKLRQIQGGDIRQVWSKLKWKSSTNTLEINKRYYKALNLHELSLNKKVTLAATASILICLGASDQAFGAFEEQVFKLNDDKVSGKSDAEIKEREGLLLVAFKDLLDAMTGQTSDEMTGFMLIKHVYRRLIPAYLKVGKDFAP